MLDSTLYYGAREDMRDEDATRMQERRPQGEVEKGRDTGQTRDPRQNEETASTCGSVNR
jgi:hypothetical protein